METEALPELSREGLEALQLRRLNEVLRRLHEMGRPYPDHLDTLEALKSLPFTTPQMLSEHPGRYLLTSQAEVSRVISGATSGTTGLPKRVFYTKKDTENTAGFFAAGISEMLSPGEACLIAFPFSGPFGLGDLIAQAVEKIGGIPIRAGFGNSWGAQIALVRETHPQCYIGFPVPLLGLMRMYGEDFPIQKALISGDACPEGVVTQLELGLGSKLYPHYGSRECGLGGAITCPAFQGMHLRENHIIPEIIDEAGNVLPDGQWGELVITTIGLEAMPLIRYRTGDYTRFLPPCPCGSVTRRIGPVFRREGPISISMLDSVLFSIPQMVDYQASFDGTLTIHAKLLDTDGEAAIARQLFRHYPGLDFQIETSAACLSDCPLSSGKRMINGKNL